MKQEKIADAHVQTRRIYNLLGEVQDLSQQLADALNYNDQVTVQMLLGMREEPLRKLAETKELLMQYVAEAGPEDAEHLRALLNGEDVAKENEKGLAEQVAVNMRVLKQVQELDKRLNQKITRGRSVYE